MAAVNSARDCPICLEKFRDPVVTPCGHVGCSACMTTYARGSNNPYEATCPTCRAPFPIGTTPSFPLAGLLPPHHADLSMVQSRPTSPLSRNNITYSFLPRSGVSSLEIAPWQAPAPRSRRTFGRKLRRSTRVSQHCRTSVLRASRRTACRTARGKKHASPIRRSGSGCYFSFIRSFSFSVHFLDMYIFIFLFCFLFYFDPLSCISGSRTPRVR